MIYQRASPLLLHREHVIYDPSRSSVETELEVTALHGLFSGGGKSKRNAMGLPAG